MDPNVVGWCLIPFSYLLAPASAGKVRHARPHHTLNQTTTKLQNAEVIPDVINGTGGGSSLLLPVWSAS
jgi:hypothetical protein